MNKEEFIGKLQLVYVGDKRASEEIILEYDRLNNIIEQLENIRKEAIRYIQNNQLYNFDYDKEELFEIVSDKVAKEYLLNILNKGE